MLLLPSLLFEKSRLPPMGTGRMAIVLQYYLLRYYHNRGCPGVGIRLVHKNQEEEKISSEIFDAYVEEPAAQEKGATLLLQRVD